MATKDVKSLLKDRRKELGLTMKDVAELVGVSEATISRWESGDIENMKRNRIAKLSEALQISPAVIMGWETDYSVHDRLIEQYSEKLLALDDAQRTAVMTMIDELLKRRD